VESFRRTTCSRPRELHYRGDALGGNTWGTHHLIPVIGWWSWNPAGHVWNGRCEAAFTIPFSARILWTRPTAFDDALVEVKRLFRYSIEGGKMFPLFPARLNRLDDRDQTLKLLARMESLHKTDQREGRRTDHAGRQACWTSTTWPAMASEYKTGQAPQLHRIRIIGSRNISASC